MTAPIRHHDLQSIAGEHDNIRRMPAMLGPASGPRNMPRSKAHLTYVGDGLDVSVRALTDAALLSQYLPPRCRLAGEPVVTVTFTQLTNLGWLAGRGYNIVSVSTQAIYEGERDTVEGKLMLCLWESKADPILTGREELGMPKQFADIPNPQAMDGRLECTASWEGYRFLELELDTSGDVVPPPAAQPGYAEGGAVLLHRYYMRTGAWDQADINQVVISQPSDSPPPRRLEAKGGIGKFGFRNPRWEDMPTQYTFVRALAALPLLEFRGGDAVWTKGIGNLKAFRVAE